MSPTKKTEDEDLTEERGAEGAEMCGHPTAFGTCWFSQIADPCGFACKWLIDQGEDAGR